MSIWFFSVMSTTHVLILNIVEAGIETQALQYKLQNFLHQHLLNNIEFVVFIGVVSEKVESKLLLDASEFYNVIKLV